MIHRRASTRTGLSLLEVLTALAIFMLSVVVISQMVRLGSQTALKSQRISRASLLCEAKMSELMIGIQPMASTGGPVAFLEEQAGEPDWYYEIICDPEPGTEVLIDTQTVPGLNSVHVRVAWMPEGGERVEYTLSRLVLDPRVRVPAPEQTTTTTTTDTTGTSGTTGTTTGGTATPAPAPTAPNTGGSRGTPGGGSGGSRNPGGGGGRTGGGGGSPAPGGGGQPRGR